MSSTGASTAFCPLGLPGWMKALSSAVSCCRSAGVLKAAWLPQGMYMATKVTRPVYVIIRWKGRPKTESALCASSQER